MQKKIFMIAVTDEEDSLNRKYTDAIHELLTTGTRFAEEYLIEPHYKKPVHDLHQSLNNALKGNQYEGYIVLLDCLDGVDYNPNVMFELGAIFYSQKPYVVISSHPKETIPFDINIINVLSIPQVIVDCVKECKPNQKSANAYSYFFLEERNAKDQSDVRTFIARAFTQYKECLTKINTGIEEYVDLKKISKSIDEIKKLISNTAEYIDGEEEAFRNLGEAVRRAQISLRTTRFANESIVKKDSIKEKANFMKSLYDVSKELNNNFHRIICNNHPAKWQDIYKILFFGGNGLKVYVRKHDFSIHFELVVIDEKVAFIHFYQADREKGEGESGKKVEKLKSTLKIQGSSICKRLANIFDRLHHRDVLKEEPSRTLLGIPAQDSEWDDRYKDYGCFVVDKSIPRHALYESSEERREYIIQMFKDAFTNWNINDSQDRVIMVSGIALVEESDKFIQEMKDSYRISEDEFERAKSLYEENKKSVTKKA